VAEAGQGTVGTPEVCAAVLSLTALAFERHEGFRLGPLDLEVGPGEFLALLGPNGAGKTTLLELASGGLAPRSGEARLFGRDPHRASRRWVARRVAVLPQQVSFPFALSVEEVVAQGRWPHLRGLRLGGSRDRKVVERAMERARVSEFARRDIRALSGGERQRVFLAKVLAQEPRLLMLDEPTASLDPGHIVRVLGPLVEEARERGLSILMASHDIGLASALADRVLLMKEGKAVALGPPGEVLEEERLREVYEAPLAVDEHPRTGRPRVWLDL